MVPKNIMQQVGKMRSSSIRIASKVMLTMGIYALIVSLFWIFLTEVMFVSDFAAYTGQRYSEFLASNPKPAEMWLITKRLIGIERLATSLLIILITQKSYGRGEKWSWYALLIAGIITWGSVLGERIAIGYLASTGVAIPIIGLILLVIGLALPAKVILSKKPN
jgi:hypothetical protein